MSGSQQVRVLVVEDDAADLELVARALDKEGILFESVSTLGDAIEVSQVESFDLVLLDLNLPNSVGTRTVELFSAGLTSQALVVVCSDFELDDDMSEACIQAGANLVMSKADLHKSSMGLFVEALRSIAYLQRKQLRATAERRLITHDGVNKNVQEALGASRQLLSRLSTVVA